MSTLFVTCGHRYNLLVQQSRVITQAGFLIPFSFLDLIFSSLSRVSCSCCITIDSYLCALFGDMLRVACTPFCRPLPEVATPMPDFGLKFYHSRTTTHHIRTQGSPLDVSPFQIYQWTENLRETADNIALRQAPAMARV